MIVEELNKHYLLPSAIFVSNKEFVVDTILGSCVALCIYDTKLKIGGINHYMLPYWNGEGLASPKYGNIANEKLVEKLLSLGASKSNMIAKVFGGANQMTSVISVGERNVLVAKEQMEMYGIRVVAENIGGTIGRKLRFNTHTNEVLMKFLSKKT